MLQMLWLIDGLKIPMLRMPLGSVCCGDAPDLNASDPNASDARIPMLQMLRIQLKFFQCIEDPANDQHQPRANYGASDAPADRWSEDSNASDAPDPTQFHSMFRGSGN